MTGCRAIRARSAAFNRSSCAASAAFLSAAIRPGSDSDGHENVTKSNVAGVSDPLANEWLTSRWESFGNSHQRTSQSAKMNSTVEPSFLWTVPLSASKVRLCPETFFTTA